MQANERQRGVRICHDGIVKPREGDGALVRAWKPLSWWLLRAWQPVRWWQKVRAPGVMWPLIAAYLALARTAKRLQSGRLEAYVGYMLVALVAVLIVAAAMH